MPHVLAIALVAAGLVRDPARFWAYYAKHKSEIDGFLNFVDRDKLLNMITTEQERRTWLYTGLAGFLLGRLTK